VPVPNLSHCDKQLGPAQPVPMGQANWDRLCLSQWDRQAACTKPVPLGLGKVKRDLALSHGTSHIPKLEAFSCPGTSSIPTMELVPVPLVPICPTKWVYKAVQNFILRVPRVPRTFSQRKFIPRTVLKKVSCFDTPRTA